MTIEIEYIKLYDEYYPKILRYLSKIAGENDAEDVAQEVFVFYPSDTDGQPPLPQQRKRWRGFKNRR